MHYGPEFLCSLLNEQPMGFYPPDALVHEAQRREVEVLPPCVLSSGVECRVEAVAPVAGGSCRAAGSRGSGARSGSTRRDSGYRLRPASLASACPAPSRENPPRATRPSDASVHAGGSDALGSPPVGGTSHGGGGDERLAGGAPPLAVRIGLGYVAGVREGDVRAIVAERERGGRFRSVGELAARCRARLDALERLAWAGACDALVEGEAAGEGAGGSLTARRRALWLLGAVAPGMAVGASGAEGTQLALAIEPPDAPALPEMTPWERLLADYGSTHVTLHEHPLELMRPDLADDVLSSAALERAPHGAQVAVAGLVVARQRPATANGVTFLLLEDEHGTINLIVPVPVYERCRLAVRAEPLVLAEGRLERREGTLNVVVDAVRRLERPDLPLGQVRHIEPRRAWSTDKGGEELRAVAPAAHSFGRRGG